MAEKGQQKKLAAAERRRSLSVARAKWFCRLGLLSIKNTANIASINLLHKRWTILALISIGEIDLQKTEYFLINHKITLVSIPCKQQR